jgi:hypothetical protein
MDVTIWREIIPRKHPSGYVNPWLDGLPDRHTIKSTPDEIGGIDAI